MRNKPLPERPVGAVGSLDRGLRLLQFIRDYGSIRVTDAAQLLEVSRSSAHRLLQTLVYRGFAAQGHDLAYYPGPALDAAPARIAWTRELHSICEPHMVVLARRCDESVNLMIRVGSNVRFLLTVKAQSNHATNDRTGIVMPAFSSSGGKALLADLDDLEVEKLHGHYVKNSNSGTFLPPTEALLHELSTIRKRGFATNIEETEAGVAAVGVAVRDRTGKGVGAITVSTHSGRFGASIRKNLVNELLSCKREIERDLQMQDLGYFEHPFEV